MSCDPMFSCCSDAGRVNSLPIKSHIARHSPEPNIVGLDGVYAAGPKGAPEFYELPPPEDAEVRQAVTLIADRVQGMIERRVLEDEADSLSESDPGPGGRLR